MSKALIAAGWDDVPHLDEKTKAELLASYPVHERDARTKGIPKLGSGAIYPVDDSIITIPPYVIPPHMRRLCAIDFGVKNPAVAWLAYNDEDDTGVIYDCWKGDGMSVYGLGAMADIIRSRGDWIPVAWPHDGRAEMPEEKSDAIEGSAGVTKAAQLRAKGCNMLPEHAQHAEEGIGDETKTALVSVSGGIDSVLTALQEGRLRVFSTCEQWFAEKNFYHRKDGRIVKKRDHLMDVTRYLWISRRFAQIRRTQSAKPLRRQGFKTI